MRRRAPGNKKRTKEQLRTIQPCSFELIVIGLRKELMEQEKELLEEEDGGKTGRTAAVSRPDTWMARARMGVTKRRRERRKRRKRRKETGATAATDRPAQSAASPASVASTMRTRRS